jgi:hypothetical protein
MKLGYIDKLYITLSSFADKEMPIKLAYKITKLFSRIEEDHAFYIEEVRKIALKHAKKNESGEPEIEGANISIQEGHMDALEKELLELSEVEVSKPDICFTLEELEILQITPTNLQILLPFIEE